jgi:hypothetical protein
MGKQAVVDRLQPWRGGRVVDGSGLENRRAERHRGFESHLLRFPPMQDGLHLERLGQSKWPAVLLGGDSLSS